MKIFTKENNYKAYVSRRRKLDDFYDSEKKQIIPLLEKEDHSLLDIGCASGGFYEAIEHLKIKRYLGVDINDKSIETANEKINKHNNNSKVDFICDDFLKFKSTEKFDIVNMYEIIFLFDNYKEYIKKMFYFSQKYIHFTNRIKTYGKTVFDMEKSHVLNHYMGTDKMLYIIFNLDEFTDYLKKEHIFETLSIYGYRAKNAKPDNYRLPLPVNDVYVSSFLIDVRGSSRKVNINLID